MAERAELREIAEKLVLAGVVEEAVGRWRSETVRIGERTGAGLAGLFRELGLVTRDEFEELELRVAQIEHRLRLLESE